VFPNVISPANLSPDLSSLSTSPSGNTSSFLSLNQAGSNYGPLNSGSAWGPRVASCGYDYDDSVFFAAPPNAVGGITCVPTSTPPPTATPSTSP
jgi:hypothetical protein